MNKYLKYLMIFIVAASFTMSFVAAVELAEHDFDGKFTALAPKNAEIEKIEADERTTVFIDSENNIIWTLGEDDLITNEDMDSFYIGFCKSTDYELIGHDGNLTLLKGDADLGEYAAGISTDGKVVIVSGENSKEVKEIASSVKF